MYRARQTNLDREVVVKTISTEYLAEFGDDQEEVQTEIQRFHREALAMAQIRHPYVLQVYDQDAATIVKNGDEVTVQYVVMEYVPGARTLRDTMLEAGYKDNERDLRQWIRNVLSSHVRWTGDRSLARYRPSGHEARERSLEWGPPPRLPIWDSWGTVVGTAYQKPPC